MKQIVRARSDEYDGDETGQEWLIDYVLYETENDLGLKCYDLYTDDGRGNGTQICFGYSQARMISLVLRLGEFVEWEPKKE